MQTTPLYQQHLQHHAKMIEFGGWMMPVQYSSIIEEHKAVRQSAGLFDVSHMGEFVVTGPQAMEFINYMVTNDISTMNDNQAMYSPMCYPDGGVVDDLLVYKLADQHYMLVVNASNISKDFSWLEQHLKGFHTSITDISAQTAQIAIQGPKSENIIQTLTDEPLTTIDYYHFRQHVSVGGIDCLLSRTGYTGEDGFELYCNPDQAEQLWKTLLTSGHEYGLIPVGLGARDTLRFESCMPLYGHELSSDITPLEAGLGMFVKLNKDFIGKDALKQQKEQGLTRKVVGLEMIGRGIARAQNRCYKDDQDIGFVTTGSFSPTLAKNLALALISQEFAGINQHLDVEIRGKKIDAVIVQKPFYRRKKQ